MRRLHQNKVLAGFAGGTQRLRTVMERPLDAEAEAVAVPAVVGAACLDEYLSDIERDQDLSRYIV